MADHQRPQDARLYDCGYVGPKTGRKCERRGLSPGGCSLHGGRIAWHKCEREGCETPTCSYTGMCREHAGVVRAAETYARKRAARLREPAAEIIPATNTANIVQDGQQLDADRAVDTRA